MIVGTEPKKILTGAKMMLEKKQEWGNPFGNGKAGRRIITLLHEWGYL